MNLRKAENYDIGLDIGTGSVGWSVSDEEGELYKFKGKTTWGSRLFPSAETAEGTRLNRGQRRRYDRRRQRLDLLQRIFSVEMEKLDPEFFIRMNQSRLLPEDRDPHHQDYRWPLFNDGSFTEMDYYDKFPTIYHLRVWLMETEEKADLRLIYLAFHNIVKRRGNFLHQDNPKLSAKTANMKESVTRFCDALEDWCELQEIDCDPRRQQIEAVLSDKGRSARQKQEVLAPLFGFSSEDKKMATALSKVLVGYVAEFAEIFLIDPNESRFKLSNDEKVEEFSSLCPDAGFELFEAIQAVYSSFVLAGILSGAAGETISYCKVREYERYANDLKILKRLIRKYHPSEYQRFFRGAKYPGTTLYDPSKANGYTLYDLGSGKISYEDFIKEIIKLFEDTPPESDADYQSMQKSMDNGTFLRRLKTSDNGSIPYQLHLEEMQLIIDRQSKYYPFLKENKVKIESLVTFRIPYYVGPLTQKNASTDTQGNTRFAWSKRLPGKESEKVYPWNWKEVIDKDASAEAFIKRMTGTCTYLQGEPVLPRCSLMYEMYCVLNELNGAKLSIDGDKQVRLCVSDRIGIVDDLFKKKKTVSYKAVEDWLRQKHGPSVAQPHVSGGQGERGFESKLSSYYDFCKILAVDELSISDIPMIEDLILWSTLFEDRSILRQRIKDIYGDRLSDPQIKEVCKTRYTGWGRLSKKLLSGLKAQTDNGPKTIMEVLEEGDPNNGKALNRAMNFMEILHDDDLGFNKLIDDFNAKKIAEEKEFSLSELQGSPALRRSVNQAVRIVDEVVGITGKSPANIFVEVTRDEDERNKGKRTKRRYDRLEEALAAFKKEDPDIYQELKGLKPAQLDERLTLYFMQRGKSMYSGASLSINRLSEYQVDHIIPQSYIKDDSYENKVLVLPEENQRKLDSMLLEDNIIKKMRPFWKSLLGADLIGQKKFDNLTRASFKDDQLKGFIKRQLVETSQIVKQVQQILKARYEGTDVLPIKAGFSSQLRKERGLVKCREINDYHHAHDAYLASQIGRFIQYRHKDVFDDPLKMAAIVRKYIAMQGEHFRKTRKMPGSANFIVSSFLTSGFDKETGEIFQDKWDADAEVDRIRRSLNFKDCFISRMPEETSGAFWDATIYSPRDTAKNLSLPLKKGLDPQKYGSYSREQFAYFFVYEVKNKKNGIEIKFEPVPVSVAAAVKDNPCMLEQYATQNAYDAGLEFVTILCRRILKYQQVIIGEDKLYITGLKEARNARQFSFSQNETKQFVQLLNGEDLSPEEFDNLLSVLQKKFALYAPRLGKNLKVASLSEAFRAADDEDKKSVLLALVSIAAAKTNVANLVAVGGSKFSGVIRPTFAKEISNPKIEFWFVDQSVTGMFERQYRLGL